MQERLTRKAAKGKDDLTKEFKFWSTQPVPKFNENFEEHGPIDAPKTVAEVRPDPYPMPEGFTWCSMNVKDSIERKEIYTLLYENYVEDDDCTFRYSILVLYLSCEFLNLLK